MDDRQIEAIAAFIEGRLKGEEREQMVRLLASSPEAYQIFVDALEPSSLEPEAEAWDRRALLAEVAAASGDEVPSPGPEPKPPGRWRVILPAVAAAGIAMVVVARTFWPTDLAVSSTDLTETFEGRPDLGAALGPGWDQAALPLVRGLDQQYTESRAAFRLGVKLVNLRIALELGRREAVDEILSEIGQLLDNVVAGQAVAARFTHAQQRLRAGDPTPVVDSARIDAERRLDELLGAPELWLGKWSGAAWLAALSGDTVFFGTDETRRLLQSIDRFQLPLHETLHKLETLADDGVTSAELEDVTPLVNDLMQIAGD